MVQSAANSQFSRYICIKKVCINTYIRIYMHVRIDYICVYDFSFFWNVLNTGS